MHDIRRRSHLCGFAVLAEGDIRILSFVQANQFAPTNLS